MRVRLSSVAPILNHDGVMMKIVPLVYEERLNEAYKLRAQAYQKYLPEGTESFEEAGDTLGRVYGVFDPGLVGTFRINHAPMPFQSYYKEVKAPEHSIEVCRMAIRPDVKRKMQRIRIMIEMAKHIATYCQVHGVQHVYIGSRGPTTFFYTSLMGFEKVAEPRPYPPADFPIDLLYSPFSRLEEKLRKNV